MVDLSQLNPRQKEAAKYVEKRKIPGAPAPEMVQRAIDAAKKALRSDK